MRKNFNKKSGFTLIELLVVLAIIGILMAIIVPKIGDARAKASRVSCASNMRNIVRAMQMYEEDFNGSCVKAITETTTVIFGRLYYNQTDPKTGDPQIGLTSLKIYNCPSSTSTPPSPNASGYKSELALSGDENIDYGIVTIGNTPSHRLDPDKNAILIEIALNHAGRNVTFWDSTTKFFAKGTAEADYPDNVTATTGITNANKIYTAVLTAASASATLAL
ncbi:MAG: hypothetical protein ACD_79C00248G0003 [uncultured bacterium]|nr:MAG: hypothetical protein ACD_79C00248G0003 [uncultured bacterium]